MLVLQQLSSRSGVKASIPDSTTRAFCSNSASTQQRLAGCTWGVRRSFSNQGFHPRRTAYTGAPILSGIDESTFATRVVLFDTGISRAATRSLNEVLDAYLTRDPLRYRAIRDRWDTRSHGQGLQQGSCDELSSLSARYWQLRCILDPGQPARRCSTYLNVPP